MPLESEYCQNCGSKLLALDALGNGQPGSHSCDEDRKRNLAILNDPDLIVALGVRETYRLSHLLLPRPIIFCWLIPWIESRNPSNHSVNYRNRVIRGLETPNWEWALEVHDSKSGTWRELVALEYGTVLQSIAESKIGDRLRELKKEYEKNAAAATAQP